MAKPNPEWKRLNVILKRQLHDQFKAATAAEGKNMTDVLVDFIERYVRQRAKAAAPKEKAHAPTPSSSRSSVLESDPPPPEGDEPDSA